MIEDKTLQLIAKLTSFGSDDEMRDLGKTILLAQDEITDIDIDKLNNLRGLQPIMYTYEGEIAKRYIAKDDRMFDIFPEMKPKTEEECPQKDK